MKQKKSKHLIKYIMLLILIVYTVNVWAENDDANSNDTIDTETTTNYEKLINIQKEEGKREKVYKLGTIVITGTKTPHLLIDSPIETYAVAEKDLKYTGITTAVEAIRSIPGVDVSGGATFGAARRLTAIMQGLPGQYSMVLLDGKRMKSEHIHTGANLSLVPVSMINRIEIIKGASSSLYGSEAFGGIINIITKPIPEKAFVDADIIYGSYDTKSFSLNHGNRINNFGYFINLNYVNTDGTIDGSEYEQLNAAGKMCYEAKKNKVTLNGKFYQNNYLKNNIQINDMMYDVSVSDSITINQRSSLKAGFSLNNFIGTAAAANNATSMVDLQYNGDIGQYNSITTGMELRREDFKRKATAYHKQYNYGFYIQDEINFKKIDIVVSSRGDISENIKFVPTGQLALMFSPFQNTRIRTQVGNGFRAPSLQDLYEYHYWHKTYWRDGNNNLKPEHSFTYKLNFEQILGENFAVKVGGSGTHFKNMIQVVDTGKDEVDTNDIMHRVNISRARTFAVDALITYKFKNFITSSLGYTFLDSEDENGNVLSYSPVNSFNFKLTARIPKIGFGLYFTTEYANQRYYRTKAGTMKTLPDIVLLNLGLNQRLSDNAHLYLRGENILNKIISVYEEGKEAAGTGFTITGGFNVNFSASK
jgi:outer membrane cobalamin receptor